MKIATWNVNSVRARLPVLLAWLKTAAPDVLLLQEIKCQNDDFPRFEIEALGYRCAVLGQKSYNGVAILSRDPLADILEGLPGDPSDTQARYIEATVRGVRVASLYLPNGNPVESEKYPYKLAWMNRLRQRVSALLETEQPFVLGGDFNVIPEDEDVYDPKAWAEDALFRPQTRAAWRSILNLGVREAFRTVHPQAREAYSFWDYQAGAFAQNKGLRIDHFLLGPEAADRLRGCDIDKAPRGADKASDHTPVVLSLS